MVKATVIYSHPPDPEVFEKAYAEHLRQFVDSGVLKNLVRIDLNKGVPGPAGPPPFYRTADLWYESPELMMADLRSEAGQAAVADLENFAAGGYQLMVSQVETRERERV